MIKTINDQLNNISQIKHSRHRSVHGFMLNMIGGLIAYQHKNSKPPLNIKDVDFNGIFVLTSTDLRLIHCLSIFEIEYLNFVTVI